MKPRQGGGALVAGSAVIGLALAGLWLWFGPPIADGLASGVEGAGGEALFTAAVFLPLLILAIAGAWIVDLKAWRVGPHPLRWGGLGMALGIGGVLLATGYAVIAGTSAFGPDGGVGAALALGVVVVGLQVLAEEALFRGWFQPAVATLTGGPAAVVIVAALFAGFHLLAGAQGLVTIVNLLLGGLLFGVLALREGGIAAAFAAHFGWNASEQLLLGLDPNPGIGGFGALIDLELSGAALWGGSDAGLNGSIAMTFALLAVLIPLIVARRAPAQAEVRSQAAQRI